MLLTIYLHNSLKNVTGWHYTDAVKTHTETGNEEVFILSELK